MLLEILRGQEGDYGIPDHLEAWFIGIGIADVDGFARGYAEIGKEFCQPPGFIYAEGKAGYLRALCPQIVGLDEVEDFSIAPDGEYPAYAITIPDAQDTGLLPLAVHFLDGAEHPLLQSL